MKKWREDNRVQIRIKKSAYSKKHAMHRRLLGGLPLPTRPMPDKCEMRGCSPGPKAFHLDHDHVTGKFRGWLCSKCNTGIGMLGDRLLGAQQAVAYLERADAH